MIENPKKFGEEYRNSPHFVENPLEEKEAIMQQIWSHFAEKRKEFSDAGVTWTRIQEQVAELQKTHDSLKNTPFWKRYFFSKSDKQALRALQEGLARIRTDMAKKDEELAKIQTDLENATRMLQTAEANWRQGLNS